MELGKLIEVVWGHRGQKVIFTKMLCLLHVHSNDSMTVRLIHVDEFDSSPLPQSNVNLGSSRGHWGKKVIFTQADTSCADNVS